MSSVITKNLDQSLEDIGFIISANLTLNGPVGTSGNQWEPVGQLRARVLLPVYFCMVNAQLDFTTPNFLYFAGTKRLPALAELL